MVTAQRKAGAEQHKIRDGHSLKQPLASEMPLHLHRTDSGQVDRWTGGQSAGAQGRGGRRAAAEIVVHGAENGAGETSRGTW